MLPEHKNQAIDTGTKRCWILPLIIFVISITAFSFISQSMTHNRAFLPVQQADLDQQDHAHTTASKFDNSQRKFTLLDYEEGSLPQPSNNSGGQRQSSQEVVQPLHDIINATFHGRLNLPLKGASKGSKLLPGGIIQHPILEKDSPILSLPVTCAQSDYAHLYRALEITVIGNIQGAFTIALRDWVSPCTTDWASQAVSSMVRGEIYGVPIAGNRTTYYVPLNRFRNRMVPRIRSFALLGFKSRPGTVLVKRVQLTSGPPPAGWVDPGEEKLARVEYFCRQPGMLALCIDDGADKTLSHVLDQLAAAEAPATFFQVGRHVGKSAERLAFARRAFREGHIFGHHTWNHDDMTEMPADAVRDDVERTREQHRRLFGHELRYFRPPRGVFDAPLLAELARSGMSLVMWSYTVSDYGAANRTTVWDAFLRAMARFRPDREGIISVQHFSVRDSVDLIPDMVREARRLGWRIVSLDECLGAAGAEGAAGAAGGRAAATEPQ